MVFCPHLWTNVFWSWYLQRTGSRFMTLIFMWKVWEVRWGLHFGLTWPWIHSPCCLLTIKDTNLFFVLCVLSMSVQGLQSVFLIRFSTGKFKARNTFPSKSKRVQNFTWSHIKWRHINAFSVVDLCWRGLRHTPASWQRAQQTGTWPWGFSGEREDRAWERFWDWLTPFCCRVGIGAAQGQVGGLGVKLEV